MDAGVGESRQAKAGCRTARTDRADDEEPRQSHVRRLSLWLFAIDYQPQRDYSVKA